MRKVAFVLLTLALVGAIRGQTPNKTQKTPDSPKKAEQRKAEQRKELERLGVSVKRLASESKYEQALPIARQSLEIADAYFADEPNLVLALTTNVATILFSLKEYNEAAVFYEKSLPLAEKIYGAADPRIADLLERLAQLSYKDKRKAQTEAYLLRVLEIRRAALGNKNETTIETIRDLADFYASIGKPKNAEPLYSEIVDLYTDIYGDEALDTKQAEDIHTCFLYSNFSSEAIKKKRADADTSKENALKGIINGKAVSLPKPDYPKGLRVPGTVLVRVKVDTDGRVYSASSFCGPAVLREISVAAARKAKFKPTLMDGKPVTVTGIIVYNYVL